MIQVRDGVALADNAPMAPDMPELNLELKRV
jgi:hypothetical protein